ncbi:MFS transporter [Kineosporia babensis]|uniref:MFS transporter n=1 Tax=Kineosporia babensis TaxID=499548 RepID=A0A9X1NDK6_9ACTN|nr:MFS transporter [Kineosporia babensis]MCD5311088.1 MFS transporter [Kineosporia babensis]
MPVTSPRTYAEVLAPPAHQALAGAGLLARLPLAVLGFSALLVVEDTTGSFTLGGAVSGVVVAANAAAGPALGRLGDRHGQARVLRAATLLSLLGVAAFVLATSAHAPAPAILAAAALAGAGVVPIGSFTRGRWSQLYTPSDRHPMNGARLGTAYAVEAVLDELVWVGGPVTVSALAALTDARLAMIGACAMGALGSILLAAQKPGAENPDTRNPGATDPKPAPTGKLSFLPATSPSVLAALAVLASMFAVGITFGLNDLSAVAFTKDAGVPGLAGTVVAAGSLGAVIGGLTAGLSPTTDPQRGVSIGAVLFLIAYTPLAFASNVPTVLALSFAGGLAYAPFSVAANRLIERQSPAVRLTESLAWLTTANLAGFALGALIGGTAIDHWGPRGGYYLVPISALATLLLAVAGALWTRNTRTRPVRN